MLHVSEPDLSGNEEAYVLEALRSTRISSSGPFVDRFEQVFALYHLREHAISVCNGTAALHLAMMGLKVGAGDEVIVPSLAFVAVANAVRYMGATPVFVEVNPRTWCMDVEELEAAITPRTRGVIPVHLYGHPCRMREILAIAQCYGLWVVEDAAEAHGARLGGVTVGRFGQASVFSFYGNKILTCGEGGAIIVDDEDLARQLRLLRGQGMHPLPPSDRRYWHPVVGHNFRLTNISCALLCAQLERFDDLLEKRRLLASMYWERLHDSTVIQLRSDDHEASSAPWVYPVVFATSSRRERAEAALHAAEVETRPFFFPLHHLPAYREHNRGRHFPVTNALADRGLCLPLHTKMTTEDVDLVCDTVLQAMR